MNVTSVNTYARALNSQENNAQAAGEYKNSIGTIIAKGVVGILTLGIGYGIIRLIEEVAKVRPKIHEFCHNAEDIHKKLANAHLNDEKLVNVELKDRRVITFRESDKGTYISDGDNNEILLNGKFSDICLRLESDFVACPGYYAISGNYQALSEMRNATAGDNLSPADLENESGVGECAVDCSTSENDKTLVNMINAETDNNLNPVDLDTPINFENIVKRSDRVPDFFGEKMPDKYRSDNYKYKTVREYVEGKHYPAGIDVRPNDFDPKSVDFCAHGTNLQSALQAISNTNMQLVPGIKQVKLQGDISKTGESGGITPFNRKYVSTVALNYYNSTCRGVIGYAERSAGGFNSSKTDESRIPVVVVGDGVEGMGVNSDIKNEVGYKRVNIRMLVLKDERDLERVRVILNEMQESNTHKEIGSIRLCTFSDLSEIVKFKDRPAGGGYGVVPNGSELWDRAAPIKPLVVDDHLIESEIEEDSQLKGAGEPTSEFHDMASVELERRD